MSHTTINGVEYPIAFTLNVMERVQDQYGSMDNWTKALEPTEKVLDEITGEVVIDAESGKALVRRLEPKIKDIIWTFQEFINEGIDIENEEKNEKKSLLTHKQVGRLITNVQEIGGLIKNITVKSTKNENEEVPNAPTT